MPVLLGSISSSISNSQSAVVAFDSIASWSNNNGSGTSTFDFSSIPQTYTHLQIRGIGQQASGQGIQFRFNDDTSTSYRNFSINSSTTGLSAYSDTWLNPFAQSVPDPSSNSGQYAMIIMDILNYKNASVKKTIRSRTSQMRTTGGRGVTYSVGEWLSSSAITKITILTNNGYAFTQYSQFDLYGIK